MFDSKGFTLLELICVVAVMGVVMAISYPSVSGYVNTKANLDMQITAQQLLFDIRDVRQKNISEPDVKYTIYIYDKSYTIKRSGTGMPVALKTFTAPQGITFTSNISKIKTDGIYFTVTGAPSSAGTIYINKGKDYYYITIQPSTGRAAIKKR
ncbi:MAG: prepilin-type N-terminal cleavage/methylation domain-containing protein [Thermoanaerobacteraceae bacterium]|nr:prepilin-type N-terminal cleavage/methylation domain-containing protein [Thermoanaerobacteraceae bacterium]